MVRSGNKKEEAERDFLFLERVIYGDKFMEYFTKMEYLIGEGLDRLLVCLIHEQFLNLCEIKSLYLSTIFVFVTRI